MKVHYKRRMTGTIAFIASLLFLYIQVTRGETVTVTEFNINTKAVTITEPGNYLIIGNGGETENAITVDASSSSRETPVNITILGVKINSSTAPFSIINNSYVNLTVEGENSSSALSNDAGIQVARDNTLIITESSTGSLTATGGEYGAGIGSNEESSSGNITIQGGTVIATGYSGIGGGFKGYNNVVEGQRGNITITGGTVTATGSYGAGIGGRFNGTDEIKITGGTVTATSNMGAGIGGTADNSGGLITISGGIVTATGGSSENLTSACIGNGASENLEIDGSTITISGGTVTAKNIGASMRTEYPDDKYYGKPGTFSTNGGNAFIIASSISDDDNTSNWSGAIILDGTGKVYGNSPVTLSTDAVIPNGKTLTVESGKTLTVAEGVTLAVENGGTLDTQSGTVNGTGKVLKIDNGTVNGISPTTGYKVTYNANDGSGRTETGYVATGEAPKNLERSFYTFKEWRSAAGATGGDKVTSISATSTIYAQWTPKTFTLPSSTASSTITYGENISYDLTQLLPADMIKETGGVSSYAFKNETPEGWAISGSTVTCTKPAADTNGKEIPFTITARNSSEAEATVKFVVNKATPVAGNFDYKAPTTGLTYDKTAKTATVEAKKGIEGMGEVTLSYNNGDKDDESDAIKAGTYTVKIGVAEGTNYKATNLTAGSWMFTIAPKTLTLKPDGDQVLYKDEAPTYASIDNQLISGDKVSVTGNLTIENNTIKQGNATLTGDDAANYELTVAETSCTYIDTDPSAVKIEETGLTGVWHKAAVTLNAPDNFLIGLAQTGDFSSSLNYDTEGTTTCTYYLQRTNDKKEVYGSHTVDIQIDKTAPEITETKIDGLSYAITINDATSGIASVTLDNKPLTAEADANAPAPAASADVKVYKGTCTKSGDHSLVVTDKAGNETTQSLHFDDPTPPTPPDPGTEPDPNPGTEPDPTYYTVTLPAIEGATTDPVAGSYEVESWSNFRFSLTLAKGYDQSQPVVTTSNGGEIKPRTSDGAYIVSVRNDMEIYIDGIVKNPDPVGNETINTGGIKVWVAGGYLHIQTPQPEQACIFTPDGRLLKALRIPAEGQRIALPKGIYLVRLTDQCVKVVL